LCRNNFFLLSDNRRGRGYWEKISIKIFM